MLVQNDAFVSPGQFDTIQTAVSSVWEAECLFKLKHVLLGLVAIATHLSPSKYTNIHLNIVGMQSNKGHKGDCIADSTVFIWSAMGVNGTFRVSGLYSSYPFRHVDK